MVALIATHSLSSLKKKPGETAQKVLCYFTAEDGLNDTELGQRLREKLPDYMLPKLIKLLNPLPLLNNGKVDRQALLADYDSRCKSTFEFPDAELRLVPKELYGTARLVLDSVARILSCTGDDQKPTLSRDQDHNLKYPLFALSIQGQASPCEHGLVVILI